MSWILSIVASVLVVVIVHAENENIMSVEKQLSGPFSKCTSGLCLCKRDGSTVSAMSTVGTAEAIKDMRNQCAYQNTCPTGPNCHCKQCKVLAKCKVIQHYPGCHQVSQNPITVYVCTGFCAKTNMQVTSCCSWKLSKYVSDVSLDEPT